MIATKQNIEYLGVCPACREYSTFKYLGVQKFVTEEGIIEFHLYTCQRENCGSTRSIDKIVEFNRK